MTSLDKVDELAQFMGHDDAGTTAKHYARYSPTYLPGVTEAMALKLQGSI